MASIMFQVYTGTSILIFFSYFKYTCVAEAQKDVLLYYLRGMNSVCVCVCADAEGFLLLLVMTMNLCMYVWRVIKCKKSVLYEMILMKMKTCCHLFQELHYERGCEQEEFL